MRGLRLRRCLVFTYAIVKKSEICDTRGPRAIFCGFSISRAYEYREIPPFGIRDSRIRRGICEIQDFTKLGTQAISSDLRDRRFRDTVLRSGRVLRIYRISLRAPIYEVDEFRTPPVRASPRRKGRRMSNPIDSRRLLRCRMRCLHFALIRSEYATCVLGKPASFRLLLADAYPDLQRAGCASRKKQNSQHSHRP